MWMLGTELGSSVREVQLGAKQSLKSNMIFSSSHFPQNSHLLTNAFRKQQTLSNLDQIRIV